MPYTMPWLQFVRSETHFWNIFLIVAALMICKYKNIFAYISAFILLYFCLGCYASMISVMMIILLGRCVLDVWFDNKNFTQLIRAHWQTLAIILISFAAYVITFLFMKHASLFIDYRTVDTTSINQFLCNFANIGHGINTAFLKTLPYIPIGFKLLLGLAIPFVIFLMYRLQIKRIILLTLLITGLLISTQLTDLLSVSDYTKQLRIDFFSMPYVYALFWTILLRTGKCWENLAILFMCISIFYSGLQDIRDQKVKHFDKLSNIRVYEDIINRIKIKPDFNPNKEYFLIFIGNLQDVNKLSTFDIYNSDIHWGNSWVPFISSWNADEYFNFYENKPFIKGSYSHLTNPITNNIIENFDKNYLLNKAKPYPSQDSVHIDKTNIYIIFSQKDLDDINTRIRNLPDYK